MEIAKNFFERVLRNSSASIEVQAYITKTFLDYIVSNEITRDSFVIAYADAKQTSSFLKFQHLGDKVLWINTFHPAGTSDKTLTDTIGQLSYFTCYRLIQRQWKLYEELADTLPKLTNELSKLFQVKNCTQGILLRNCDVEVCKSTLI